MKYSSVFITLLLSLAVSAAPQFRGGNGGNGGKGGAAGGGAGKGGKGGATGGKGGAAGGGKGGAGAANGTDTGAAGAGVANGTDTGAAGSGAGAATGAANGTDTGVADAGNSTAVDTGAGGDPQTSLTLDPAVIAEGFADDGQDVPTAGQVASLTSTNNFINFCLTVPNLPITNGKQIKTGSCNPAPMGEIPSTDNMPSSKFTFPKNGQTIAANQAFTISMAVSNFETGNFVNANENYFSAPQQLNGQGQIKGHSHVVVEQLTALDQTTTTDPNVFAFFKGLNAPAAGGILTASVDKGLPAGVYKVSSINTAANHQPVLVPIAQHGSLDDVVYFTISDDPAAVANSDASAAAAGLSGDGSGAAANSTADASTTTAAAASDATDTAASDDTTTSSSASAAASTATTAAAAGGAAAAGKGGKGGQATGGQAKGQGNNNKGQGNNNKGGQGNGKGRN